MKTFKIILLFTFTVLNAQSIDIYVLNPEHGKGFKQFIAIAQAKKKSNHESLIIDSRDGKVFFRGSAKDIERKIKNIYKKKNKASHSNDIAYTIHSLYKFLRAKENITINLFFINSVLYKDEKYDFEQGSPNDAFLVSPKSKFSYLSSFKNVQIKSYILMHKRLFINNDHKEGIERFYSLLFKRLDLNLQTFNTSFSMKNEKIDAGALDPRADAYAMKVDLTPIKKLHFEEDEYKLKQHNDMLSMTITNKDRANMLMTISLNSIPYAVPCDNEGICQFEAHLLLGDNNLTYKNLDNSLFEKNMKSSFIPADEVEYYVVDNELVVKVKKSHRPEGNEVILEYVNDAKKITQKIVNGYYEFRVPLEHAENQFKLYSYSGSFKLLNVTNKKLKAEEERLEQERIAKLKEKARLEAIAKLEAKEKKRELEKIAQKKKRAEAINKGVNKVIDDTEILVNNYSKEDSTKKEYKLQLNTPRRVDTFELTEYDADSDGFDIYIENSAGDRKEIAINVIGSGDNVSKTHKIVNPYKKFIVNRIIIKPKTNLGGVWRIDQALVKYGKEF